MRDSVLYYRIGKANIHWNINADFYYDRLIELPENRWVQPTNADEQLYTICQHLFDMQLICKKEIPIWHNGSTKGKRVYFYYNHEMDYKNT